jgi:hypothetical protein
LFSSNEELGSLSEALLLAPFVQSLTLETNEQNFSSLPLSALRSFKLTSESSTVESVSKALTKSKPKSLTHLELDQLTGSFETLAGTLVECPSLTNLIISELNSSNRDILPVVQVLHRLPLVKLTLDLYNFTDESMECLLSFLSQSAVQDLKLGRPSPKQLQLVADALPSLSCLQSLEFDTFDYYLCEHESSHLALFSVLPRSSLRSLTLSWCSFRLAVFDACLDKIPETQLTRFQLKNRKVYAEGFDPTIHDANYKRVDPRNLKIDWTIRFPQTKDRFCHIHL